MHSVPGPGVTDPTLSTVTGTSLARMVTVMVKVTVPPLGATVIGTPVGDPCPSAARTSTRCWGLQVQVAPAASSGGSGRGSEKAPEPVALLPGLVTVTV